MDLRFARSWSFLAAGANLSFLLMLVPAFAQDLPPPAADAVAAQEPTPEKQPEKQPPTLKSLLEMNLEQLGNVPVRTPTATASPSGVTSTASGTSITPTQSESAQSSTAELFSRSSSVTLRRTSALGLDPRVRGYHAGQINANASGMTQYRSRIDIDSLFSQIDAGNVQSVNVVDGPYSSWYGPGFAFLSAELIQPKRYADGPENHVSSLFTYGTNGSTLYSRDRAWGGGADWGYDISYGLRVGSDYTSGGGLEIPASYNQQDVYAAFSFDLSRDTRIEVNYLRLGLRNVELPGVAYDINRQTTDQVSLRWVMQDDLDGPEQAVVQFWTQRTPFNVDSTRPSKQETVFRTLVADPFSAFAPGFTNLFGTGLTESWGARALRTLGSGDSPQWTVGVDWRRIQQRYLEVDLDDTGAVTFGGNLFGIPDSYTDDFGILTHLKVPVAEELDCTIGGRYDFVHATLAGDDPTFIPVPTDPTSVFRPGFNEPSFSLFMAYGTAEYRPAEVLKINAGLAYAMRAPNLVELYNDEPTQPIVRFGNSYADGNSQLAAERNLQLDLGAIWQRDKCLFGIRGFHSTIYNYIMPIPSDFSTAVPAGIAAPTNLRRDYSAFGIGPGDPTINFAASTAALAYRYTNLSRATLAGGEIRAQIPVSNWLTVNADVAYVKGVNHDPSRFLFETEQVVPVKGAEALPGIYPFNAAVRFLFAEPAEQKWGVEVVVRLVHGQDFVADSMGELPTDGFTTFDVHGYYQFNEQLRLFSSILNLFDRDYTEHGSLVISNPEGTLLRFVPEAGFSLLLGLEARY